MGLAINLLKAPHIGIRDLKERLSQFLRGTRPVVITDRGEPTNVILPYEEMMELLDIIEEMSDAEARKIVTEGRRAVKEGAPGIPVSHLFKQIRAKRK